MLAVMTNNAGFISASADGIIKVHEVVRFLMVVAHIIIQFWNDGFDFSESVDDHSGIILSMTKSKDYLVTGSSDHSIKV